MKPSELKELVKSLRKSKSKRAILIESSPGIGKTQIAAQAASELEIGFKAIHAPLLNPEDYGMPVVHGAKRDQLKFVVSAEKFPLLDSDCEEEGILLIDELPQADQSGQKVLANLVQEREIHGHRLKPGWFILATGNRQKDRSGANRILGHLANRMTRIQLEISLDDWSRWALENGVKPEVVAFIRFRPNLLSNYDGSNEINATPRAWVEGVSARIGVIKKEHEFSVFSGDVGEGPAAEFLGFLKIFRELPSIESILKDPKNAPMPKELATKYALCGALVGKIDDKNYDTVFGKALEYVKRMPPEFSMLFCSDSIAKCEHVSETKNYIQWATKQGAALLSI